MAVLVPAKRAWTQWWPAEAVRVFLGELASGAGITIDEASNQIVGHIDNTATFEQILACTSDPLAIEIETYAMYLATLTAHVQAPWKRFAAVMADCHAQLQVTP